MPVRSVAPAAACRWCCSCGLAERQAIYLLLASADVKPVNQLVPDLVAEPVEISGEVARQRDLLILRTNPATQRRIHL